MRAKAFLYLKTLDLNSKLTEVILGLNQTEPFLSRTALNFGI